jgi:ferredoxin-thioredoxin reductase catalytic chain
MAQEPTPQSLERIRKYVEKYRAKTGTTSPPMTEIAEAVMKGLALHLDQLGKPLCPCVFYPDKQQELAEHGRRWVCACDEMKRYKYCHCLLFVTPEGLPITEYLPEDHEGQTTYGLVLDPTPAQGREGRHHLR